MRLTLISLGGLLHVEGVLGMRLTLISLGGLLHVEGGLGMRLTLISLGGLLHVERGAWGRGHTDQPRGSPACRGLCILQVTTNSVL